MQCCVKFQMYSNMIQFYNTYMYAHIYSFSGSFPIYVITKYRVQISVLYNSVLLSHSVMSNSCDPMDCSTPGFCIHDQLLDLAETGIPVFLILLFSSISLHLSLRKAFLSLLAILWNSAFKWAYISFSPLPLASLFSVICEP